MTTATAAPASALRFVGIDPSLTGTGLCLLDENMNATMRTIKTDAKSFKTKYERLDYIVREIMNVAGVADASVCIERPFVNPKNMNSQLDLISLAHLIRRKLYYDRIPFREVSPPTLKKFVCGSGNSQKSMMLMRVFQNWHISAGNDNEADAVGLAYMAKAVAVLKEGGAHSGWTAYQVESARRVLEGE